MSLLDTHLAGVPIQRDPIDWIEFVAVVVAAAGVLWAVWLNYRMIRYGRTDVRFQSCKAERHDNDVWIQASIEFAPRGASCKISSINYKFKAPTGNKVPGNIPYEVPLQRAFSASQVAKVPFRIMNYDGDEISVDIRLKTTDGGKGRFGETIAIKSD
jgi:hypothetical protein